MAELNFNIEGNSDDFIKKIEQMRDSIISVKLEFSKTSDAGSSFSKVMKKTFDAIGGQEALKQFVSDVIRVRGECQQLELSFNTLLQSEEKSGALMSQLMKTATETPFNLTELAAGAKELIGYGAASEEVSATLLQLGNIASGAGIPLDQLASTYGKVMSQGSLNIDELNAFSVAGIPMLQGLSDTLEMSTEKVNEMVAAGKVGFPQVQGVIESLTSEGGQFYAIMDEQSKSIVGAVGNLQDAWEMMLNDIGKSQGDVISGSVSSITYLVEHYEQIGKILLSLIEIYGVYRAACIANIVLTQSWATTQMELGLVMAKLQKAFIAFTASMNLNPWVLAATAIIGLGIAMWNLADHTTAAEKAQRKFNEEQNKFNQQQQQRKQNIESLIHVIQNETETEYAKIQAYEELEKCSPALTNAYLREEIALLDLAESQKVLNEERDEINYDHVTDKVNRITESLKRLKAENGTIIPSPMAGPPVIIDNTAAIQRHEEELKNYNKQLAEYNRLNKEAEENKRPITERIEIATDNLEKIKEEYNKINTLMMAEHIKAAASPYYTIPLRLELEFNSWDRLLQEAQAKLQLLKQQLEGKTYQEALGEAKKTWQLAKQEYEKLKKSATSTPLQVTKAGSTMNTAEKAYQALGGSTDDTEFENRRRRIQEEQKKIKELRDKQEIDEKQGLEDLEDRVAQAKLSAMDEGNEKTLARMQLNHEKEIDEIKKLQKDYLQKKIDAEKAIFEAKSTNEGKSFDSSEIILTEEEKQKFSNILMSTVERQGGDISSYYKDLLSKYQGYVEKRLSIQEKFQKERDVLEKAGASEQTLAEHDYQGVEALDAVDSEFAMREDSFKAWTDSIANLSLIQLQELLFKAEQELQRMEFLNPKDSNLASQRTKVTSLKNTISEKSTEIQTSPENRSVKDWQDLYRTLSKVEKEFDEIGDAVGGTAGKILSAAGGIASSTLQMIDGIVMLANGSSSAMSGTSQAASASIQAVEKASVILAIIGAALQIATKLTSMFGADYSDYNKAKENYEDYVEVLDVVIGKQQELLETLTGKAAVEA